MSAANQMRDLLNHLEVNFFDEEDRLTTSCPVHAGDNEGAWNINVDPNSEWFGSWFCNTQKCHERYHNDPIGLIQGILTRIRDESVTFMDTIEYIESTISIDTNLEMNTNRNNIDKVFFSKKSSGVICKKDRLTSELSIPCPYFLDRGFSKEVLEEFSIGMCNNPKKPMYKRSVFPIFRSGDTTNSEVVGVVGRSTEDNPREKWKFSKGFSSGKHLFNYNKAFDKMKKTNSAVLVEGQGDVVKLYEAGIINCVGIFGCDLSDDQSILLERAAVDNIFLMLDNDEAGKKGAKKIIENFAHTFNVKPITFPTKDAGDLSPEQIKTLILPQLGKNI